MKTLSEINLKRLQQKTEELKDKINNFDCSEHATYESYSNFLDEIYGEVEICGYQYSSSYALQKLDPIAYNCGFSDYCYTLEPSDFEEFQALERELEELQEELKEL